MRKQDVRRALLSLAGRALSVPSRSLPPGAPRRVLVVRPDHLGDLLFTVPALRLLRAWLPQARITALVGPWAAEVLERSPYVDAVQTCSFPWFDRGPKGPSWGPYQQVVREGARLRTEKYDIALVLRFDHWWGALLTALAGIPQRVGYDVPECRPNLSHPVPYLGGRHEVEQNVRLVAAACGRPVPKRGQGAAAGLPLEFPCSSQEDAAAKGRLGEHGIRPLVALHVGAGAPVKLWPPDHFARVGNALQERYGAQTVLTGSQAEAGLVDQVAAGLLHPPIRVVGAPLGEVAAVLRSCRLVVGVDSGVLHLAVAVGTPSVHLYGPVAAGAFGPWGDPERHRVVLSPLACAPCNRLDYPLAFLPAHPCIRDISVERVLEAADAVLQRGSVCA